MYKLASLIWKWRGAKSETTSSQVHIGTLNQDDHAEDEVWEEKWGKYDNWDAF